MSKEINVGEYWDWNGKILVEEVTNGKVTYSFTNQKGKYATDTTPTSGFLHFARKMNITAKFETEAIKTGTAEEIGMFAYTMIDANIPRLAAAVIRIGTANDIRWFARWVRGADIEILEDAIIKTGDIYQIRTFGESVKGANIEKLQDALNKTRDAHKIRRFAETVKGANIEKLEDAPIR